ncbi:MAG TPA: phosphoribosyltransferase [Spirochaetia bacterium]|nr:phosphoribosyltransferase [Spirochaetia bacterium]
MGKATIISYEAEPFSDREEAGREIAAYMKEYRGAQTVVLGILRGGIIVARTLADELGAACDMVLARKLGAPFNPELAVGAVSEEGELFVNPRLVGKGEEDDNAYIQDEKERQLAEIKRRRTLFRKEYPKISLTGKTVIVTDDGIATGSTMRAALWSAGKDSPERLVAAVPVAAEDTVVSLAQDADEILCLRAPRMFYGVGQFYRKFPQVSDREVLEVLRELAGGLKPRAPPS